MRSDLVALWGNVTDRSRQPDEEPERRNQKQSFELSKEMKSRPFQSRSAQQDETVLPFLLKVKLKADF